MRNLIYSFVFTLAFLFCSGMAVSQTYTVIKSSCYAKNEKDSIRLFAGEVFESTTNGRVMLGTNAYQIPDTTAFESLLDTIVKSKTFLRYSPTLFLDSIARSHGMDSVFVDIASLIRIDSNMTFILFGYEDTIRLGRKKTKLYLQGSGLDRYFRIAGENMLTMVFDRDKYYQDEERRKELQIESLAKNVDSLKQAIIITKKYQEEEKSRWLYGSMLSGLLGFLLGGLGYWFVANRNKKELNRRMKEEVDKRSLVEKNLSLLEQKYNSAKRASKNEDSDKDIRRGLELVDELERKLTVKSKEIDRLNSELALEKEKTASNASTIGSIMGQLKNKEAEVFPKIGGWQAFTDFANSIYQGIKAAIDGVSHQFRQTEGNNFSEEELILFGQIYAKYSALEDKYAAKSLKWFSAVDLMQKANGSIVDKELYQNIQNETDDKMKAATLKRMFLKELCQYKISNTLIFLEEIRTMPQLLENTTEALSRFCNDDVERLIKKLKQELEGILVAEISYVRLFQEVSEDPEILGQKHEKKEADSIYLKSKSKITPPRTVIEILKFGIQSEFFDIDQRRTNVIVKSDS